MHLEPLVLLVPHLVVFSDVKMSFLADVSFPPLLTVLLALDTVMQLMQMALLEFTFRTLLVVQTLVVKIFLSWDVKPLTSDPLTSRLKLPVKLKLLPLQVTL